MGILIPIKLLLTLIQAQRKQQGMASSAQACPLCISEHQGRESTSWQLDRKTESMTTLNIYSRI